MSVALRVAPLVFVVAILQVSSISGLRILGAEPDLLLVTLVASRSSRDRSPAPSPASRRAARRRDDARDARADVARAHPRRLLGRTLRRDDRPRPRVCAARSRPFALTIVAVVGGDRAPLPARRVRLGRTALVTRPPERDPRRGCSSIPSTASAAAARRGRPVERVRSVDELERSSSLSSDAPYGEPRTPSSRFLPPDPGVEAPYRLTPGPRVPRRRARRRRARRLRGALLPALVAAGALGRHAPRGRAGQPAAHDPGRGAARARSSTGAGG